MDAYDRTAEDPVTDGEADEVELTAEEREGFASLPDRAAPSDLLEERVVGALRSRGILGRSGRAGVRSGAGARAAGRGGTAVSLSDGGARGRPGRFRTGTAWWASPWSWAAGVALFLGGGVVGHGVGASTTADAFLAVREQDATLQVQEAGTAYVSALLALEAMQEADEPSGAAGTAREVASSTLLAAASAYSRLDPDGPLTPMLTTLLEEQMNPRVGREGRQQTIWF